MSIVLAILKWIGILVGGVLGLLLLLALLVLLVPVRYRVAGKTGEPVQFGFRLSWLAYLVMIKKKPDSQIIGLYLFGIPVRRLAGGDSDKKSHKKKEKKEKDKTPPENPQEALNGDGGGENAKKPSREKKKAEAPSSVNHADKKKKGKKSFSFGGVSSIIGFIREVENRLLFRRLWRELWLFIRYLSPKKFRGQFVIGTGDPSSTGLLIGGMSLLPFAYQKGVHICPDFEEKVFEAEGYMKGRIRILYLVRLALRIYRDRDLRRIWRELNNENVKKKEAA